MASEKRLIDVNPFMKAGWHLVRTGKSNEHLASLSLADVPTVDTVEVVRCKDCKHYMLWEDSEDKRTCSKSIGLMISDPDDFCSYGERKDNG